MRKFQNIHNNKKTTMIRSSLNTCAKLIQPFGFSTHKLNGQENLKTSCSNSQTQRGYRTHDAQRVFQQFFKENPPAESEKSFFDMTYAAKEETPEFDPYKTLGIQKSATKETVKLAYRELAMKYHPKKDSSFEAAEKFINISRAFDMLNEKETENKTKTVSFADEFEKSMKDILASQMGISKNVFRDNHVVKAAELYSESKKCKTIGNVKQVTVEKEYNRNGKVLKFTRVEKHHQNGFVEVAQQLDNGYEIKTRSLNF